MVEVASETWTCPHCGLYGQTRSGDPERTNLAAHLRIVKCYRDDLPRQPRLDQGPPP